MAALRRLQWSLEIAEAQMLKNFIARAGFAVVVTVVTTWPTAHAQPLPTAAPESAGMSSQRLANIDAFFKSEIERTRVPGAVVAIARGGKLVYFRAFGFADKDKGVAMNTETIFQLASMTKIMAAAGALQLTEQGALSLRPSISHAAFEAGGIEEVQSTVLRAAVTDSQHGGSEWHGPNRSWRRHGAVRVRDEDVVTKIATPLAVLGHT